jgi:SAM-dependent methyltransferase
VPPGEASLNDASPAAAFGPDYYRTVYRHYERQNPPYKKAFYREIILKHSGSSPARLLDVGCAFGGWLADMPESWDRFGIDVSSYAVQQAAETHPQLHVAAATLDNNPFPGPFDVITSFDVVEHIENLENVAARIARLLKPGGLFVFVVPTYDGPFGPLVHLLDRDPTHIHKTNRHFWLDWAARHFDIQEWLGAFRILPPIGPYIHWPTRALRSLSPAILVVARTRPGGAGG